MSAPWLITPSAPAPSARRRAMLAAIPRIVTERLILRAPCAEDWPVLEPIWTTEQAAGFGGPVAPEDGWLDFNQLVASWLLRGFGPLTVTLKETGEVLGLVSLDHEWGDPAPELGWLLIRGAEGRGYGLEAARALADWALAELGADGVDIYIERGHRKSERIAEALGARIAGHHPLEPDSVAIWRLTANKGATS